MITADTLLASSTCADWPRDRIDRLLASPTIDASSWVALATSCQALGWQSPAFREAMLTARRHAHRLHRSTVLKPWLQAVTRDRVATIRRWYHFQSAPAEVAAVMDRLDAWDGNVEQASAIAAAAYAVAAYAPTYAANYVTYAANDAAGVDCAGASDTYEARWRHLLDLCQRIDAAEAS